MGLPWYSSSSDFNYDFHATLDQAMAPVEYNYRNLAEFGPEWQGWSGEMHGISAFLRRGNRVFHTYSSYARGTDLMASTYNWLDLTARGRQEDWEQPPGRSDSPLMGWLRHHDRSAPSHHESIVSGRTQEGGLTRQMRAFRPRDA